MYKAILLSIGEPVVFGIYHANTYEDIPKLICILRLMGKSSHVLPILFAPICSSADILQNKGYSFSALLQSNITSLCELCDCVIDRVFFMKNDKLRYVLEYFKPCMLENDDVSLYDKCGIYINDKVLNLEFARLECTLDSALQVLTNFTPLHSIYYSRGVGSLSAIKLTHIFLHTLALSVEVKIFATNSFYFSKNNEIKAFANMSFFLDATKHLMLTDDNALKYIRLAKSSTQSLKLHLPYKLIHDDFLESCTPLYVTPAV